MKSKFSVGNRISHQDFGEGMIIQIKGNQLEILFLDEQRRSLSADSQVIKIIGSQNFEPIVNEPPIPSAANKIKKELDQLKEGNRIDYFDYEMTNRNKSQSFNKNSRVFHSLLGEGMITKILKNEYQIIFLNGNKQNIAINSPDLKMLSSSTIDITSEVNEEINNPSLQNSNDLFVGKHVSFKELGEGMVSKIANDSYEIIFLDGHRESFPLQNKPIEKSLELDIEIPVEIQKTSKTVESVEKSIFKNDNIADGKQITHPVLGEGMISKFANDSYEIIFLDGHKESFPLQSKPIEKITKHDFEIPVEKQKNKKTSNQTSSFYNNDDLVVGKQITHPELGEGMVSKIANDSYEIIFLDGHKESFPLQSKPIEKITKHDFEIPVEIQKNKKISNLTSSAYNASDLEVGKQITHPVLGEGMIIKITDKNYEIIFLDGHKESFPINSYNDITNLKSENRTTSTKEDFIEKPLVFEKTEKFELPIEKYQRTQENYSIPTTYKEIESFEPREKQKSNTDKISNDKVSKEIEKFRSDEIQIGSAVTHPKNGSGIVCNIDDYEIEVVFYNHKKIVYSSKNNELTFLNVNGKH